MNFSKFNRRIKFIILDKEIDEDGYPIKKEIITRTCWASIKGLRGNEFYNSAQEQFEEKKIINCRYFKGLSKKMKIKYKENIYDIISINDLYEKHAEYEIYVKMVNNND